MSVAVGVLIGTHCPSKEMRKGLLFSLWRRPVGKHAPLRSEGLAHQINSVVRRIKRCGSSDLDFYCEKCCEYGLRIFPAKERRPCLLVNSRMKNRPRQTQRRQ